MANIYESMNVMEKLSKARLYFLNQKVSQSGKHMKLEFTYFELSDIVPPAIRIFARVGLVYTTDINREHAVMTVYNANNPEEPGLEFSIPYAEMQKIISKEGKDVTNDLQALGSSITYLRRYLWMLVLDVTEPDSVNPVIGMDDEEEETIIPAPKKSEPKPPATVEERKEAKKELTAADGQASADEIKILKGLCKELREKDETQEEFVQKIALKTDSFTNISQSACTALCENLKGMIEAYG